MSAEVMVVGKSEAEKRCQIIRQIAAAKAMLSDKQEIAQSSNPGIR